MLWCRARFDCRGSIALERKGEVLLDLLVPMNAVFRKFVKLINHPLQGDVAELEFVFGLIRMGCVWWSPFFKHTLEALPPGQGFCRLFALGRPATTNVAMVAREPDLFDVLGFTAR